MLNYVIIVIFRKLDANTFCAFVLDSVSVIMFITALYLVLKNPDNPDKSSQIWNI